MILNAEKKEPLIQLNAVHCYFGANHVQNGISLTIYPKEIVSIIGFSGCGKTTLLRSMLMLQKPTAGSIRIFNTDIINCSDEEARAIQKRWGVMFQSSALFSSMTVLENIMFPFEAYANIPSALKEEVALLKLKLVGLPITAATQYPAQLSGGMKKRAALARAIVLDPELVFLDEPTAGLDIQSASEMDNLILDLRNRLGITFVMITHDLDIMQRIVDRVIFLGEGKVLAAMPIAELIQQKHPLIQKYFSSILAGQHE